jgi:hypothetical protein
MLVHVRALLGGLYPLAIGGGYGQEFRSQEAIISFYLDVLYRLASLWESCLTIFLIDLRFHALAGVRSKLVFQLLPSL